MMGIPAQDLPAVLFVVYALVVVAIFAVVILMTNRKGGW